jgi:aspartyl-tRNA(Asn)/glutamyl-tRNA(Gln) amidotransferase subunit C
VKIDRNEVEHIASLARLALNDAEIEQSARQLSQILDYMSVINELNLEATEPLSHVIDLENVSRCDEEQTGLSHDAVMDNAPQPLLPFFKVPRVIE